MIDVTLNTTVVNATVQEPNRVIAELNVAAVTVSILGSAGPAGAQGSVWLTGAGVPDNGDGRENDMYLNTEDGTVYKKLSGVWVLQTNISGDAVNTYTHVQAVPVAVWTINHNLGFRPNIFVTDTAGDECEGSIDNPTLNQVVITFSAAFAGTARLN